MSTKMSVRYGVDAKSITEAPDTDVVTFIVIDGDDVVGRIGFDFDEMPDGNRHRIFLYGANKLLTDRTSEQKDKLVKLDEMQVVFDMLVEGEWAKERQVGAVVVSAEVEALAELMKISIVDTQRSLAAYSKEQRKAILAHEDVVKSGKIIRAKRMETLTKSLDEYVS